MCQNTEILTQWLFWFTVSLRSHWESFRNAAWHWRQPT